MNEYKLLTQEEAVEYVRSRLTYFSKDDVLIAKKFAGGSQSVDGHANIVFLISSLKNNKSVVLKQVLPYVRSAKEDGLHIALPLQRIEAEVESFKLWNTTYPGSVPSIYLWDNAQKILIMEDLSRMKILSSELIKMKRFPKFPQQIGTFLGRTAFYTSDLFLKHHEKKGLEKIFNGFATKSVWENFMFTSPILDNSARAINVQVKNEIDDFCNDKNLRREVLKLRDTYIDKNQCLTHSDLHASNIFVDSNEMRVFDSEFAAYAPVSFDIGRIMGSIVLNYASLLGIDNISKDEKQAYQKYLLEMIEDIYHEFEGAFIQAWDKHIMEDYAYGNYNRKFYMQFILEETIGYTACASVSRIYDSGLSQDFIRLDSLEKRAKGQRFIIYLAKHVILNRKKFHQIEEFTDTIRNFHCEQIKPKIAWVQ